MFMFSTITINIDIVAVYSNDGVLYPFVLSPVSSFSSSAICPPSSSSAAASGVFIKSKVHADLYTNYYNGGVIMGDEILFYDKTFDDSCATGTVTRVDLGTGRVTNTTYMIDGVGSGQPIYYDGTHLWLLPKCSMSGDTLYDAATGSSKAINASLQLNLDNKRMIHSKTSSNEYLYWYDRSRNDVYYYDITTQSIACLQLSEELREYSVGQGMTVYSNKLVWLPSIEDLRFTTYDLTSGQFSTLTSSDLSTLESGSYICYTCGMLVGSSDKIVLYRNLNNNGIGYGSVFVTLTLTPPSRPVTRNSTTISATVALNNAYIGRSYLFTSNGTYSTYRSLPTTDVAYGCVTGKYHYVNEYHILLSGFYTYFAKPSIPNTMTIGSNDYDIVSVDKLPKRCLPLASITRLSFSDIDESLSYNQVYSSRISSNILLINNDGTLTLSTYNVVTNTVTPVTLTPPSSVQYQLDLFMYPVSIDAEYDYWLYNGYRCQLVSSTDAQTITLPGMLCNNIQTKYTTNINNITNKLTTTNNTNNNNNYKIII